MPLHNRCKTQSPVVVISIAIQAIIAITLYDATMVFAQKPSKSRLFHPYTTMGHIPQAPWPLFGQQGPMMPFMNNYPTVRSPFMNSNAFLGNNHHINSYNPSWSMGANNMFNPYRSRRDEIYTAIGYDRLDQNSQMRLTITERPSNGMHTSLYPQMNWFDDDDGGIDYDRPTSWYVQGSFLSSQLKSKAGTYHVVLTTGGRTADGCVSESLGQIVSRTSIDASNPFNELGFGNQLGLMPNKLLVGSSGPTVYASTLDGVSRRQLVGSAIAACEYVQNGVCGGYIPFCGTVSKDVLPAMEVPLGNVRSGAGVITFDPNGFSDGFSGGPGPTRGDGGFLGLTDSFAARNQGFSSREDETPSSSASVGLLF